MVNVKDSTSRSRPGSVTAVGVPRLIGLAVAALAGLAVYLVGLPASVSVFGTPLADLTLPASLLVALTGTAVVGASVTAGRWRVVDIVVASVIGVAGGLVFSVWNLGWEGISKAVIPPASAIFVGVWLFPAVLGMLVVRRPGAAVYTELVAAVVSALVGNQWGFATVWYGLVEGLGAEAVFALLLYRRFGMPSAALAGAGAGVAVGLMDSLLYYLEVLDGVGRTAYVGLAVLSGAVIAGAGSWVLSGALARTGALDPLASGRVRERV
jgi:energy-coupling factor transport system substrate-specific component